MRNTKDLWWSYDWQENKTVYRMVGLCLCWRHCSTSNIRNKRTVSCAFSFVCVCFFLYGPLDRSIAVKNGQQYWSSKIVQWLYGLYAFGGNPKRKVAVLEFLLKPGIHNWVPIFRCYDGVHLVRWALPISSQSMCLNRIRFSTDLE